jgi:cytochrome P450 / NADPH-cytochrome P450 reductase
LKDEIIGGKYPVKKGETIVLLLAKAHKDPAVYGDDADQFKPERMLDENFDRLTKEFPNCWKPFGNGIRACIGRPLAWQETLIIISMLLQNFNFVMDDPLYQLKIKQTLTIKPQGFCMRAIPRNGMSATQLEHQLASTSAPLTTASAKPVAPIEVSREKVPQNKGKAMSIFYGSNAGTCEAFAQRLSSDALGHGFYANVVDCLDSANQKLPTDHPVVIITASYEGQPPDNAAHFIAWLESLKGREMENVSYTVFGCGMFFYIAVLDNGC